MSYRIIWMPEALASFEDRIFYLNVHWTEREITNFKKRVLAYLETLSAEPLMGKKGKLKNVHIGFIIKEVSLIYRVKASENLIELLLFIDNRQDPRKFKKYKP